MPGWVQWAYNDRWNSERFTDLNGNRLWDPGEPFLDGVDASSGGSTPTGAQDGQYTAEFYDPGLTGYLASNDLGQLMRFKVANPGYAYSPGQFYPLDLPIPDQPDVGVDRYRWNIANCNPTSVGPGDYLMAESGDMQAATTQGVDELITQDPTAEWDPTCNCVRNSAFGNRSPRIIFVPVHDPRVPLQPGNLTVRVVKIVAMFLERTQGREVWGRFAIAQAPGGVPCENGAGYLYDCPVPTWPVTWGRVKATYR